MAYITTNDLKTYRDITGNTDDTLLGVLIADAQKIIDAYCIRTFEASADATRYLDAERDVDGLTLRLDRDLCAITSITNGDGSVLAATDYVTEPRSSTPYWGIRLLRSSGHVWTYTDDPENAIKVIGKWAYSATAPADIAWATLRLAAYLYNQRANAGDLDRPILANNVTIMPARLPADIRAVLDAYKRRM